MDFFVVALLGLVAGTLINALADDLPYRRSVGLPTYADGTPRPISAWSGISAFLLGQRKPSKKAPNPERERPEQKSKLLTWRYPLTELLSMGLMLMVFNASQSMFDMTLPQLALYFFYMALFTLVTVIDLEHKLILFVVTIPFILIGLVDALVLPEVGPSFQSAFFGGLAGFGVFFALFLGGYAFNHILGKMRGEEINTVAFGYGDVMLITVTGVLLGLENIFFALFITVFLGAVGATFFILSRPFVGKQYQAFMALPYGPYIVAGTIIMMFYAHPVQCALWGWSLQGAC